MTIDYTSSIGQVRLLIPDIRATQLFTDDQITAFLSLESSRVKRAAALALETMASDEVLIQKALSIGDLTTNGPSVSAALLTRCKELRAQDAVQDESMLSVTIPKAFNTQYSIG